MSQVPGVESGQATSEFVFHPARDGDGLIIENLTIADPPSAEKTDPTKLPPLPMHDGVIVLIDNTHEEKTDEDADSSGHTWTTRETIAFPPVKPAEGNMGFDRAGQLGRKRAIATNHFRR